MISKEEAMQKLKKMGLQLANDNSMITVLLPREVSFETGLKDVKGKLKQIDYQSSFCVKYATGTENEQAEEEDGGPAELSDETDPDSAFDEDNSPEEIDRTDKMDDFLSLDEDGQFSLGNFGLDMDD